MLPRDTGTIRRGKMKLLQVTCVMVAIAVVAIYGINIRDTLTAPSSGRITAANLGAHLPSSLAPSTGEIAAANVGAHLPSTPAPSVGEITATIGGAHLPNSAAPSTGPDGLSERALPLERAPLLEPSQQPAFDSREVKQARLEEVPQDYAAEAAPAKQDFSFLAYYAYAEVLPDKKPADTVLESMKGIPVGTPVEEIKRASEAFGLDFVFMRAVAKIESDFDPKQRTGSYIGLFQLSNLEFAKYGSGSVTDPRDNAVAAAYKFVIEGRLFELDTHKKPTLSDLYLIHQQGLQGAAEHVSHPERIAWESMCATDEGREKGERWCKRAIWKNTLPAIKHAWKSVEKLTSAAFVAMWQGRVDHFYARYSEATTEK